MIVLKWRIGCIAVHPLAGVDDFLTEQPAGRRVIFLIIPEETFAKAMESIFLRGKLLWGREIALLERPRELKPETLTGALANAVSSRDRHPVSSSAAQKSPATRCLQARRRCLEEPIKRACLFPLL
ncbi:MAG: hypothetical protein SOY64_04700 [Pyramidobacter sp.]|nr:hypothetical protein [Pyramidobacter sp.]